MKIVAIVGSMRKGNTYAMTKAACEVFDGGEVEIIHLRDVLPLDEDALDCDRSTEHCLSRGFSAVVNSLKEADGIILATPARWSLMSGELKMFLDHLNPFIMPGVLADKKALVLAVGQSRGEGAETIRRAARSVEWFCEHARIEVVAVLIAEDCLHMQDCKARHPGILEECQQAAMKLQASVRNS
jgi:multimeric flavodoxin WrbA